MQPRAASPADLPLSELLQRLAARTPSPGGGSASAVTCALAASLVEMAAGFGRARADAAAPERQALARTAERAAVLRARALEQAEIELYAYQPVLEALALPRQDPQRARRVAAARAQASASPLAIAELAAELAGLAAVTAGAGSPHLAGDAIAAAVLAEGACAAAARLVTINLAGAPDDPRLRRAGELVDTAGRARVAAIASG
jgi:formiminotetrahydrofolate cyclodeaminase